MSSPPGVTGPQGHQINSGTNSSLGAPMPQSNQSIDEEMVDIDGQIDQGTGGNLDGGHNRDLNDDDEITWSDDEPAQVPVQDPVQNAASDAAAFEELPFADNMDEDQPTDAGNLQQRQLTAAGNLHEVQQSVEGQSSTQQTGAPEARTDAIRRDPLALIEAQMKAAALEEEEAKATRIANEKKRVLDAQKVSAQAESSKRSRPATSPAGSPTGSNKKPMNPWGKAPAKPTEDDMKVDTPPEIDFNSMMDNIRVIPCAVMILQKTGVIGTPTTLGATPGMSIKLRLDAGKHAMPSIALDFRISKTGVDSKSEDDYNSFSVSWGPGVKIGGEWMMEALQFFRMDDSEMAEHVFFPEIQDFVKTQADTDKLVCGMFQSHAHKSSEYSNAWPKNLKGKAGERVRHALSQLMKETGHYMMMIWFMVPTKDFEYFDRACLSHLTYAVQKHLPPYHVYRDENGEPQEELLPDFSHSDQQKKIQELRQEVASIITGAKRDREQLIAENRISMKKLKDEHSRNLETVRAENVSLRLENQKLEEEVSSRRVQQRKWRKLFEDFLSLAPQVDRDDTSRNKVRKAFGAFSKLIEVARKSLQEI